MPGLYSRIKNWVSGEILTHTDLNAEFDNVINNFVPQQEDDYSTNIAQMQTNTDPYPGSVESLPTSMAGELERLRYLIKQITGEAQWYIDPDTTIASIISGIASIPKGSLPAAIAYEDEANTF